jgi:hypothetical protein
MPVPQYTADADEAAGDVTMNGYTGLIVISVLATAVALGACRREEAHVPMKLGAPAAEQVAR